MGGSEQIRSRQKRRNRRAPSHSSRSEFRASAGSPPCRRPRICFIGFTGKTPRSPCRRLRVTFRRTSAPAHPARPAESPPKILARVSRSPYRWLKCTLLNRSFRALESLIPQRSHATRPVPLPLPPSRTHPQRLRFSTRVCSSPTKPARGEEDAPHATRKLAQIGPLRRCGHNFAGSNGVAGTSARARPAKSRRSSSRAAACAGAAARLVNSPGSAAWS